MKKHLLIASCLAFVFACSDNNSNRAEQGTATDQETGYSANGDMDSTAGAAVSAATRQSEVDTNRMNIGTDRSLGGEIASAPSAESIARGEKLIASSDCLTCHKVDQKIVGPAYQQVAEKYAYNDTNVDYLAGKIIKGGAGVWGQIAMNPHPNLSQEDAQEMARYILSLKK